MALMYRGMGDSITEGNGPERSLSFPPVTITGEPPKSLAAQVLPWVIGVLALGAVYYFANGAIKRRRRARTSRPFVG
jgi:hypothetical protein